MDDALMQAFAAVADDRYKSVFDRGFACLSYQLAFPDRGFTEDNADEAIALDRKGDLEADAISIIAETQEVLLFQSKSSADLDDSALHGWVAKFLDTPNRLCSEEWLKKAHEDLQAIADEVRIKLANGYSVRAVFATGSNISDAVQSTFAGERRFQLPVIGEVVGEVTLLGAEELAERYRKLLLGEHGKPTNVEFVVAESQFHKAHDDSAIYLTIPASVFAAACKEHASELFRYNPRLYLGPNKINKTIADTLKDTELRHRFHLLNNGITAVGLDTEWADAPQQAGDAGDSEGRKVLRVKDFQIVNGCQTSTTLFRNESLYRDDPQCLVSLKIIRTTDEDLRSDISRATNNQTSVGVEERVSNNPEQQQIALLFAHHNPPYFYAAKPGEWDQLPKSSTGQGRYSDPKKVHGRFRKVTSKELASICLAAVFGDPESAKDKPTKLVFEEVDGLRPELYRQIFNPEFAATQWLLPVELHRQTNAFLASLKKPVTEDEANDELRIGTYGRYRLMWLVYGFLVDEYGGNSGEFLPAKVSERLLATCEQWAPKLLMVANNALNGAYNAQKSVDKTTGLREFFREPEHRPLCQQQFAAAIAMWASIAKTTKSAMKESLGLPV